MNKKGFKMKEEGDLNDLYYEDRPMRLVVPDPLQKADEQELEQIVLVDNESVSLLAKEGCSGNPFLIFPVLLKTCKFCHFR